MANDEHVALLKQGVAAWNAWRDENRIRPDLTGALLFGANLSGANLTRANFGGANLSGADLSEAKLIGAKLSEVNLSEAKLGLADLRGANLGGADLNRADLHRQSLVALRPQSDSPGEVARSVRIAQRLGFQRGAPEIADVRMQVFAQN
jgi:hypothetical protein